LERLAVRALFRDGGLLLRKRLGFANDFKFALQPLEVDHLDRWYSGYAPNGNEVRLGVETDKWRRVTAYYIIPRHPGDFISYAGAYARERVPAEQVIHLFMRSRVEQSRGVPFIVCSLLRLTRLGKYEQAEVDSAYEASCKGGFIENELPVEYDGTNDGKDNQTRNVEPGMTTELDPGQKFVPYNPEHPTTAYPNFVKQQLRSVASGQGVNYATWTSDLEGANYSSMRAGLLPERDRWMMLQRFISTWLHQEVWKSVLPNILLGGFARGVAASEEKNILRYSYWNGRRWGWVDPAKDLQAKKEALALRVESRQNISSEAGKDFEETCKENEEDERTLAAHGLEFVNPTPQGQQALPQDDAEVNVAGTDKPNKVDNGNDNEE
jgi:lambda family phage portal protein